MLMSFRLTPKPVAGDAVFSTKAWCLYSRAAVNAGRSVSPQGDFHNCLSHWPEKHFRDLTRSFLSGTKESHWLICIQKNQCDRC